MKLLILSLLKILKYISLFCLYISAVNFSLNVWKAITDWRGFTYDVTQSEEENLFQ
jgi:hypothetical protein